MRLQFVFEQGHLGGGHFVTCIIEMVAPDIYGQRIANPIAMIWAGAMMLDFLGEKTAHDLNMSGISRTLETGQQLTRDLGGSARTDEMGDAICANILQSLN